MNSFFPDNIYTVC